MSNDMQSYIDALRHGSGYDWICGYYNDLSKADLANIIKELDYAIYANLHEMGEDMAVYEYAADEIEDRYPD